MKSNPSISTTAPGQFLGYSLQFPRALCRLLQVGHEGAIGVELLGDVNAYLGDGSVLVEEDKSSIKGNPLTDRSTDLWKTIYNWIKSINGGVLTLNSTQFVLYCNQEGRRSLVNDFDEASSIDASRAIIVKIKKELGTMTNEHPIWLYYDYAINQNEPILQKLIPRFSLVIGKDTAHSDVQHEVKRLMLPKESEELIMNELGGWFQRKVMRLIKDRKPCIVRYSELKKHVSVLVNRIRQKELVDYAARELSFDDNLSSELESRPVFVKQLDLISLEESRKVEAVADYLRAVHNRNRWIENEILDEHTAEDFEGKLQTFWENSNGKGRC